MSDHLLPPGLNSSQLDHIEAPADTGRSFLVAEGQIAYPTLDEIVQFDHTDLARNPAYMQYMLMHKVLVGNHGASQLEQIHGVLKEEMMPHYLVAAGWAAAESALVRSDKDISERLLLLDEAVASWRKALNAQAYVEQIAPEDHIEHAYGHRIALDIAIAPLLAGIICGDVRQGVCEKVFRDCLNIAQSNAVYTNLMARDGNLDGIAAHVGLGYECNALLAFNMRFSQTWFAIPSMARSDSGYFHRRQTHDLLVIHQKRGAILSATPVEIKAKPSARDRNRYDALLVRGKMHLSVEGKYTPDHTLAAITSSYEGNPSNEEERIASSATNRFTDMVRDYYAGEMLGKIAGRRALTIFHDSAKVIANHPGLAKTPAA